MTKLRHLIEVWLGIMTFIDSTVKMGENTGRYKVKHKNKKIYARK